MYFLLIRYYPRKKNFDNSSLNSLAFGNDCWNKTSNRNKNSPLDSKPVILPQIPSLFFLSLPKRKKNQQQNRSQEAIISFKGVIIFTPFDLSAAITLLFLSLSSSRLPIPSRGEREKEGEDERKEKKEGWAKMGEKGGKTARGQDDGLVYESPRNNGSPFYSWSTPLFEGSTWTWKGYHSTPEFPSQEKEGIFRRVCSRFIGRVNLSNRGTRRARCRQWRTDPSSSPTPQNYTPGAKVSRRWYRVPWLD